MAILFNFQKRIILKNRKALKLFIIYLLAKEKVKQGEISFVFCDDQFLLKINKTYLHHDYFTDIITFDLTAKESNDINGEIYIGVESIKVNAKRFNVSFTNELHRVIFHGLLHLCGYKDKTPADQLIMRGKEDYYLKQYFG